jgi:tetratricopeptide (TPR) repeat protein
MLRRILIRALVLCALAGLAAAEEKPLTATREWLAATAAGEGLYPGGMAEAPEALWTLYAEGVTALQTWELETAETSLTRALELATRDSERLAVRHALAVLFFRRADWKNARLNVDKALNLAEAGDDRAALAYVLKDASQIHRLAGDTAGALALAKRGSEIAATIDNPALRALYQLYAAEIAFETGDLATGTALIDEAEPVLAEYQNATGLAMLEFYRGFVKSQEGDVDGALILCRKALETFRQAGDRHSEGRALNLIGSCLEGQKDYDGALASHNAALEIFRSLDDRICEAKALLLCSEVFIAWDQYDSAITALDEALAISRENAVVPVTLVALKSLALCQVAQGDVAAAMRSLEEAKKTAAASHDEDALRKIDFVAASLKLVKGHLDVDGAIQGLTDLEKRCEAAGDQETLRGVYDMLAEAYFIQEDVPNVIRYRCRLVDAYLEDGDQKGASHALGELSLILMSAGLYEESMKTSLLAIRLDQELGNRDGEGYEYRGVGICLLKLKRYDEAREALEKAAEIHHGTGNANQLGRDYLYLCALARVTGRDEKAEEFAAAATKLLGSAEMVELCVADAVADAAATQTRTGAERQPENAASNQNGAARLSTSP